MEININTPVFDNWYIDEKIGSGAFGTVYRIKREDFGKVYYSALKVIQIPQSQSELRSIQSEFDDDQSLSDYYSNFVQDFAKEIEVMAELKGNSNIVSFEDHAFIRNDDGISWTILIRMELLMPFVEYQRENTLENHDVVKLGIDICSALELCEKRNIIHRDIKPDNIFLSNDGNYELGDFGIARELEKTTGGLSKKGTYSYMAPEVYLGQPYNNTVDIYSLGIVMYKLLNHNRAPFMPEYPNPITFSDREKSLQMRMNGEEIPDIKDIPKVLNNIVKKACAFNLKDRYQSASDFKHALIDAVKMDALTVNRNIIIEPVEFNETSIYESAQNQDFSEKTAGPFTEFKGETKPENEVVNHDFDEQTVSPYDSLKSEAKSEIKQTLESENENNAEEIVGPCFEKTNADNNDNSFDNAINAKRNIKKIIKKVTIVLSAIAVLVLIILLCIRSYNMNISNPSGSVDLTNITIASSDEFELSFKPTDNVETIMKNNPELEYSISYVGEVGGNYLFDSNVEFNHYFPGEFTYNLNIDSVSFYCMGENTTPSKCHLYSLSGYSYTVAINNLSVINTTPREVVQVWGAPDKVTKQHGGLFKRLYYYGEHCNVILFVDALGRIDYVDCDFI